MLSEVENILKRIESTLQLENWDEGRIDEYLDHRESETFEENWLAGFKKVEEQTKEQNIEKIGEIRKIVFLEVFKFTNNDDMSAYVSDDFDLMAKNIFLNLDLAYLNEMWENYKKGKLPM